MNQDPIKNVWLSGNKNGVLLDRISVISDTHVQISSQPSSSGSSWASQYTLKLTLQGCCKYKLEAAPSSWGGGGEMGQKMWWTKQSDNLGLQKMP